jgi:hypothetical protein
VHALYIASNMATGTDAHKVGDSLREERIGGAAMQKSRIGKVGVSGGR